MTDTTDTSDTSTATGTTAMTGDDLLGLVPTAVDAHRRLVSLIAAGSTGFNEPFYRSTIQQLERDPRARRRVLSFAELDAALGEDRPVPAGLVSHTSRCGSTLLVRMLRHDRTRLVLSEPSPVGTAHQLMLATPSDPQAGALFTDLLALLERFARGRGRRTIVKLSSWQSRSLPELTTRFPATPNVFLHRPADGVVASLLAHRPSWGPDPDRRDRRQVTVVDGIDPALDPLEVYASVWAALVTAALDAPADRVLFVRYADLMADTEAVLERVAAHLALDPGFDPRKAAAEKDYYAKAEHPSERFEPEGRHQRPALTADQLTRIEAIIGDLPTRLAERTEETP